MTFDNGQAPHPRGSGRRAASQRDLASTTSPPAHSKKWPSIAAISSILKARISLTTNEESSGIIPLANILGNGWYAATIRPIATATLPSAIVQALVEGGQLCLLYLGNREADLVRAPVIQNGATWRYFVGATDPGATWKDVGYNQLGFGSGPRCSVTAITPRPSPTSANRRLRARRQLTSEHVQRDQSGGRLLPRPLPQV